MTCSAAASRRPPTSSEAVVDPWGDLSDEELFAKLTQRGVTPAQAAWAINNRDDDFEATALIARTLLGRS